MRVEEPHAEIIEHMRRHFGAVQRDCLTEILPVLGVTIHIIPPRPDRDFMTLFTAGISDRPLSVPPDDESPRWVELTVDLPSDWPVSMEALADPDHFWPFQWLRRIAEHLHGNGDWLREPCTVFANEEPPEPLASNTQLSCLMLLAMNSSPPPLECGEGKTIRFFQLYPLYTEERDLEMAEGLRSLLIRFQDQGITDVVDLGRVNVAR